MFRFASPEYLYLLVIIPLMILMYVFAMRVRHKALRKFGNEQTVATLATETSTRRVLYKFILLCAAILCIIVGIARPQFGSKLKEVTRKGIEIMIAVDVSNSMLAEDFEPSRLERTKFAIDRLTEQLSEDKIGLIVFDVIAGVIAAAGVAWVVLRTVDEKRHPEKYRKGGDDNE